jgi:3-polyprenyl-4-hydroxybenzoate decarboxylase
LAIPLYAEQPYTADSIVKQQIGRVLNKLRVKKTEMLEEINEVEV